MTLRRLVLPASSPGPHPGCAARACTHTEHSYTYTHIHTRTRARNAHAHVTHPRSLVVASLPVDTVMCVYTHRPSARSHWSEHRYGTRAEHTTLPHAAHGASETPMLFVCGAMLPAQLFLLNPWYPMASAKDRHIADRLVWMWFCRQKRAVGTCSSVVEHPTADRAVPGSTPGGSSFFLCLGYWGVKSPVCRVRVGL